VKSTRRPVALVLDTGRRIIIFEYLYVVQVLIVDIVRYTLVRGPATSLIHSLRKRPAGQVD
jgi:hypothetical protein